LASGDTLRSVSADHASPEQAPTVEEAFGRALRSLRRARGLSQEQLAEAASLHVIHISRLENGRRGPTLTAVFALARALGVEPVALVGLVAREHPRLSLRGGGR
jgi:transcriptional regulator with XRE-family HTH domain